MDWLYYVILILVLISGLAVNLFGLPGLWLMVAGAVVYAWITRLGVYIGTTVLVILVVVALVAEIVEFLAGSVGAKRAGAGKSGMAGAIIGSIVGAIIGTPLLPVIGTILGACIGSFAGAIVLEVMVGKHPWHATRIGWGAAKGRFLGIMLKSVFGFVILLIVVIDGMPIHGSTNRPLPTTLPTKTVSLP